jgi:hypothetical protein
MYPVFIDSAMTRFVNVCDTIMICHAYVGSIGNIGLGGGVAVTQHKSAEK